MDDRTVNWLRTKTSLRGLKFIKKTYYGVPVLILEKEDMVIF